MIFIVAIPWHNRFKVGLTSKDSFFRKTKIWADCCANTAIRFSKIDPTGRWADAKHLKNDSTPRSNPRGIIVIPWFHPGNPDDSCQNDITIYVPTHTHARTRSRLHITFIIQLQLCRERWDVCTTIHIVCIIVFVLRA